MLIGAHRRGISADPLLLGRRVWSESCSTFDFPSSELAEILLRLPLFSPSPGAATESRMVINSCKRPVAGEDKLDRLTGLPINVLHHIQERMPFRDSARMMVLSRKWVHIWASNPKLIFDSQSCAKMDLQCIKRKILEDMGTTISTILLNHDGVISTFHLNVSIISCYKHSPVKKWMLFLSKKGLTDLTLENLTNSHMGVPYKLPSYVYGVELERLALSSCIFAPLRSFTGFYQLKWISLKRVTFGLNATTSSLSMPSLERLNMQQCNGLNFLKIYAPKLRKAGSYRT